MFCERTSVGLCRFQLNSEQPVPGWVLVNVATPTDYLKLAGYRIAPRGKVKSMDVVYEVVV